MKLFNPAVFNSAIFNTADVSVPPPPGGHRPPGEPRRAPRLTLDIVDPDEAALVIAFLRHRFRI